MSKVYLEVIYKKVKQRIKLSTGDQLALAVRAKEAARVITINPTLKSVSLFRKSENLWRLNASPRSVSIADEFESVIRQGNFVVGRVYNSSKTGHRPYFGYLYCFVSDNYPDIVKIGSTSIEIRNRLSMYKSRHNLDHLAEAYSIYVSDPAFKEDLIHDALDSKRKPPETIIKSREWYEISIKQAIKMINKFSN